MPGALISGEDPQLQPAAARWKTVDARACANIPEADVSQPLYFCLHVLLQLSRPQQYLADGADRSLAVIQRYLLFTCADKKEHWHR